MERPNHSKGSFRRPRIQVLLAFSRGEHISEAEAKTMAVWNHATLGTFSYENNAWVGEVFVQAFRPFSYRAQKPGKFELAFATDDENELPTRAMISAAERVVSNAAILAREVVDALWDDFKGTGPDSGIWWHGDLAFVASKVAQNIAGENPAFLTEPADLYPALGLKRITVSKRSGYGTPMVELSFAAAFEEEYGVGIATDGRTIAGIGYIGDLTPFEVFAMPRRTSRRDSAPTLRTRRRLRRQIPKRAPRRNATRLANTARR
jgi:hypothetical protein